MGSTVMHPRQVPCWITHTNARTHEIIRSGFDRSPCSRARDQGRGPLLPSVDKVDNATGERYQIFHHLEPGA